MASQEVVDHAIKIIAILKTADSRASARDIVNVLNDAGMLKSPNE